jgi:hypothetical protein
MALDVSGMTAAIEAAFDVEWRAAKGSPAPGAGSADRHIMFAAVARGVLQYMKDHQDELVNTVEASLAGGDFQTHTIRGTDLNIDTA